MVFKDVPAVRIGRLMLNFGGTETDGPANLVPFRTILPYLVGNKGWIIAGVNLVGNIVLLIPVGFLASIIYRKMTRKKVVILAILSGFVIEGIQVVLDVGIFDIDDVILNALGVVIGYGVWTVLAKRIR